MFFKLNPTARILTLFLLAAVSEHQLIAAGPAPVNLGSTASFTILAGAAITTTGGGIINGNVGASPIAGSAIGVALATPGPLLGGARNPVAIPTPRLPSGSAAPDRSVVVGAATVAKSTIKEGAASSG